MELGTQDQILDEAVCVSLFTNFLGKGMTQSLVPPVLVGQIWSLAFIKQPV